MGLVKYQANKKILGNITFTKKFHQVNLEPDP